MYDNRQFILDALSANINGYLYKMARIQEVLKAIKTIAEGDDYVQPTNVWTSGINGLLSGRYDVNRVNKGIDQAFTQSPYLKTN